MHKMSSHANSRRLSPGRISAALPWLLFIAYPLALFVPSGIGVLERFRFALPTGAVAGLACALFLLVGRYRSVGGRSGRLPVGLRIGGLTGLLLVLVVSLVADHQSLLAVLQFFSMFSIPLWFALGRRRQTVHGLTLMLAGLWLFHLFHLLWDLMAGQPPVGISGNRNWMASLALALAPWAWLAGERLLTRCKTWSNWIKYRYFQFGLRLLIVLVTGLALWFGGSRAVWLLLALYMLWLFCRLWLSPGIARWCGVVGLLLGLLVVGVQPRILRQLDREGVRWPVWQTTLAMVADHGWLGVGPGGFRREFPGYRRTDYMALAKAASITDHPHNEILHLAVSLGIPLALLWSLFLLPLAYPRLYLPSLRAVHFSTFILVGHGMLDLTLARPPTGLLGLLLLGLLWRPYIKCRVTLPDFRLGLAGQLRLPQWVGAGFIVVVGCGVVYQETRFQWSLRRGEVAMVVGDHQAAYQAYLRAGQLGAARVEPLAKAGDLALFSLNQPGEALLWLAAAAELEPDFGRLNGHIAIALSRLGEDWEALAFFEREAKLFPFDPNAQFNRLTCQLLVGEFDGVAASQRQLAKAIINELRQFRSPARTAELAVAWQAAVERGAEQTALTLAAELTGPLGRGGHLPQGQAISRATGLETDFFESAFRAEDFAYWQWLAGDHGLTAESSLDYPWPAAVHRVERARRAGDEAALLVDDERQLLAVLIVSPAGEWSLESGRLRGGGTSLGEQLEPSFDNDLWNRLQTVLAVGPGNLRLLLPVSSWDVAERQRILTMILAGHGIDAWLPPPVPPAFRQYQWLHQIIPGPVEQGRVEVMLYPWRP